MLLQIIKSIIKKNLRPFVRPLLNYMRKIVREEIEMAIVRKTICSKDCLSEIDKKLLNDIKQVKEQIYKSHQDRLFEKLVAGKSVAVVGNGPQQINKGTGKEIDAHDIVIRFNNFSIEGYEKDYGKRTDIWVRNCNVYESKNRHNPGQFKMIVWKFEKLRWDRNRALWFMAAAQALAGKIVYGTIDQNVFSLKSGSPTLGAIVIKFLVSDTKAKSVNAYGFSFLDKEGEEKFGVHYYDDYFDIASHNYEVESKLLREMLIEGRRMK